MTNRDLDKGIFKLFYRGIMLCSFPIFSLYAVVCFAFALKMMEKYKMIGFYSLSAIFTICAVIGFIGSIRIIKQLNKENKL